jgi:heme A synthase
VLATYLLIVAGAVVRSTGSGLGCPDWPLCHGSFLPPPDAAAIIEYTHRLLASSVGFLVLATVALWIRTERAQPWALFKGFALLALLGVQIGLGAVTVALELPPMIVLVHLGLAMLLLGALVMLATSATVHQDGPASRRLSGLLNGALIAVFLLILTGAYVRASGASWACVGFPTCNGELLPFGSNRLIDIHLLHRVLAVLVAGHLLAVIVRALRERASPTAVGLAATLLIVLAAQVLIGASMVGIGPGPAIQALHVGGAAALWGTTVALWTSLRAPARESAG